MRSTVIAVVAAMAIASGACSRENTAAAAADTNTAAQPADARAKSDRGAKPDGSARVQPSEAAKPEFREVTVPAGTALPVVLETSVGSDTSRSEDRVEARVSAPVMVHGVTVVPEGSTVRGVVTDATRSGKVKGLAHLAMRFDTLVPRGSDDRYDIRTSAVGRTAESTKKKDAMEIGGGAAGGALIGGLIGGKKGALIGTAAGGGAGTAVSLSTRGKEVHLPKGSALTLKLTEPLTVRVKS